MKSARDRPVRTLSLIYRGLLFVLIILGLLLVTGTIYGIFSHGKHSSLTPAVLQKSGQSGQGQTFTGIGRIRVPTASSPPGMVIIFITFIYYPEDKAFSEELALRVSDFRETIEDYFGHFSILELKKKNEDTIKTELLKRFNAILRLGQIETLFFSDFIIVE